MRYIISWQDQHGGLNSIIRDLDLKDTIELKLEEELIQDISSDQYFCLKAVDPKDSFEDSLQPKLNYCKLDEKQTSSVILKIIEKTESTNLRTLIQNRVPGANNYLETYNKNLAERILQDSNSGTLITSVGGVKHALQVQFEFDNELLHISGIGNRKEHLRFTKDTLIEIEHGDSNYYINGRITNYNENTAIIKPITFTYGRQTQFEKHEFDKSPPYLTYFKDLLLANFQYWFEALRVPLFLITLIPFLVSLTTITLYGHSIDPPRALITLLALFMMQTGASLLNDFFDMKSDEINVFHSRLAGGSRFIQKGLIQPIYALSIGSILIGFGVILGLMLNYIVPTNLILFLGIIGSFIAYFYTGNPIKLIYRGIGEVSLAITFGLLVFLGTFYVQTEELEPVVELVAFSLPYVVFIIALLLTLGLLDIGVDRIAGKKTTAVRLGSKNTILLIRSILIVPYLIVILGIVMKLFPISYIFELITLPIILFIMYELNQIHKIGKSIDRIPVLLIVHYVVWGMINIIAILLTPIQYI